jgi:dTDP-glucose pyrophosphorylase
VLFDDVSTCTVPTTATLRDVAENLESSGLRHCLVVDIDEKLVGIVSDGDIRRGLLAGRGLDDTVVEVMNTRFVSAPTSARPSALGALAKTKQLSHIPIVDLNGRLAGLFIDKAAGALATRPNTVVIMAGGLGLRLRPLTETVPKPMLSVAGKPMVQHTLEALRAEGFRKFLVSLNYLGEQIEQHFGDGSVFGVRIHYIREEKPLGTAGALSLLAEIPSDPIVVVNGDVLLSARISDIVDHHNSSGAEITVGVKVLDTQIPFGVVEVENGRITGIIEKPVYRDFVNAGVYVLSSQVIADIVPGEPLDMPDLVAARVNARGVFAFALHESWRDLGRLEDLEAARRDYEGRGE